MKKKVNQVSKNISIVVSCYKYAPESITACLRVENPHNPNVPAYYSITKKDEPNAYRAVKESGYNWVCGKHKEVFDTIKKALRLDLKSKKRYTTYGFMNMDGSSTYGYFRSIYCSQNASYAEKLATLKRIKEQMQLNDWKSETHTTALLDGNYKPEKVEKHFTTYDKNKMLILSLV